MNILAVGVATLDIINVLDSYPAEDAEVRALSQRRARGGNATNTLVALSQLGHACSWAGSLANEPDAQLILQDLQKYQISTRFCEYMSGEKIPTSYISLSKATGSRTIVHYRDMPEYPAEAFDRIDLDLFDWVHFEGRDPDATKVMLRRVRDHGGAGCSLEVEKPRNGIESLFELPQILFFSRHYARSRGFDSAHALLAEQLPVAKEAYCAWGERGASVRSVDGDIRHSAAFPPARVVDTLGAGDVFNAAVIHARAGGMEVAETVEFACRLAGYKCGISGFAGLAGGVD